MIIVHILLWILKIAGILILLVLGLLLLGVLMILFVPIRYELSADGNIEEPEKITGKISIRYFFRMIRFQAVYENQKFHWMAGIAWKKIGQDKEEEPEKEEVLQKPETGEQKPIEQESRAKESISPKTEAVKEEKPSQEKQKRIQRKSRKAGMKRKRNPDGSVFWRKSSIHFKKSVIR